MKKFIYLLSLSALVTTSVYAAPPPNIACVKNAVTEYYVSGEYEKDVDKLVQGAESYLFKRINENNLNIKQEKFAIILDIDDTSISNFTVNKVDDFSNSEELISKRYEKANSPAVKPVLRLYNEAIANGVEVFFVTFRPKTVEAYTITNLKNEGYLTWSALYQPNSEQIKQGSRKFKTEIRKTLTEQGYHILLNLGDQDSDLDGGYAEFTVKIPNPMYTSGTCTRPSAANSSCGIEI